MRHSRRGHKPSKTTEAPPKLFSEIFHQRMDAVGRITTDLEPVAKDSVRLPPVHMEGAGCSHIFLNIYLSIELNVLWDSHP